MIRVAIVDRHPAVRTGVEAILRSASGLTPTGTAANQQELWPLLHRTRPDVVLIDHHPRSAAGLILSFRVKSRLLSPQVVICTADAGTDAIVPATLAGADGIVDKAADPHELLHTVRVVARGEHAIPRITPTLQAQAARRLEPLARAILAMRLANTTPSDIATTVGLSTRALDTRIEAILAELTSRGDPEQTLRGTVLQAARQSI